MALFKKDPKPKPGTLKIKRPLGEEGMYMSPGERRVASGMWDIASNRAKKEVTPTRTKTKYNTKASGGVKPSIFGRKPKSTASTAKGMTKFSSNPAKKEKQLATKRAERKFVCSPTSKSKSCGPGN